MSGVALEWESEHSLKGRQKSSSFKLREREREREEERENTKGCAQKAVLDGPGFRRISNVASRQCSTGY